MMVMVGCHSNDATGGNGCYDYSNKAWTEGRGPGSCSSLIRVCDYRCPCVFVCADGHVVVVPLSKGEMKTKTCTLSITCARGAMVIMYLKSHYISHINHNAEVWPTSDTPGRTRTHIHVLETLHLQTDLKERQTELQRDFRIPEVTSLKGSILML